MPIVLSKRLTAVDGQEQGGVHTVVDKWRLPVQHGSCINSSIDGVDIQPACWVLVNRVPEEKKSQTSDCIPIRVKKYVMSTGPRLLG